jgi:hypothetical protein
VIPFVSLATAATRFNHPRGRNTFNFRTQNASRTGSRQFAFDAPVLNIRAARARVEFSRHTGKLNPGEMKG